ncbi:MAG: bacillithiol biosynthesis cysteine-adding enzyme BshC [Bacteroidota bacterium]
MQFSSSYHSYNSTGLFSKLVVDYIAGNEKIRDYYSHRPDIDGIKLAIADKKKSTLNRELLYSELVKQYDGLVTSDKVSHNIVSLLNENTFTICTAHQPNIFTGHLYFIYKIVHAIKLADELNGILKDYHFVPVYYMGSEDADLNELGEVTIDGEKHQWQTTQKGAVGRMKIDNAFISLIENISLRLSNSLYGAEVMDKVRNIYTLDKTIQQATLEFVNELFSIYGLIVFIPDNLLFKKACTSVFKKELTEQFSHKIIADTVAVFPSEYKIQASGRPLNLFYLKDDIRERIEKSEQGFLVRHTNIQFTEKEILNELALFPDRFSPNVILRPLMQELLLPNMAFIGGGGELAYWLELKKIFDIVKTPFPVLILRNSFTIIDANTVKSIDRLALKAIDFFAPLDEMTSSYVKKNAENKIDLKENKIEIQKLYSEIKNIAAKSDPTLMNHVDALLTNVLSKLESLETKMLRAERRKADHAVQQIQKIKMKLFPGDILQERVDNLLYFYSAYGVSFIEKLYENSSGLNQRFCILTENVGL